MYFMVHLSRLVIEVEQCEGEGDDQQQNWKWDGSNIKSHCFVLGDVLMTFGTIVLILHIYFYENLNL